MPPNLDFVELEAFLAVIAERSFSRAAMRMHRTQSAISYAISRLERKVGDRLFHRSSNSGQLTEAGEVLRAYAERLVDLADEARHSVRELRDLRRGRVLVGANDGSVPMLMPFIKAFRAQHPQVLVDLRRVDARHVGAEVLQGQVEFGVTTFPPRERRLRTVALIADELVAVVYPSHPFASRTRIGIAEWAREPIVIINQPSPARDRVIQLAETKGAPLNVQLAMPTLDSLKAAVMMELGISLLPRWCAVSELESGRLIGVPVAELRAPHVVQLVYRRSPRLSHAGESFLALVRQLAKQKPRTGGRPSARSSPKRAAR